MKSYIIHSSHQVDLFITNYLIISNSVCVPSHKMKQNIEYLPSELVITNYLIIS